MAGAHPLAVEPVPQAMAERQRIEADATVEPGVCAAEDLFVQRNARRDQLAGHGDARPLRAFPPGRRLLTDVEQKKLEPIAETLPKLLDDARVEEQARRERIRQDEPHAPHLVRRRSHWSCGMESISNGSSSSLGKKCRSVYPVINR